MLNNLPPVGTYSSEAKAAVQEFDEAHVRTGDAKAAQDREIEEQEIQAVIDSEPTFGTYSAKAKEVMERFDATDPRRAKPKHKEQSADSDHEKDKKERKEKKEKEDKEEKKEKKDKKEKKKAQCTC